LWTAAGFAFEIAYYWGVQRAEEEIVVAVLV